MDTVSLLLWARGPGLQIASAIFVFGLALRGFEILMLGRKVNLSATRSSGVKEGFMAIINRSLTPDKSTLERSWFPVLTGYVFHIGLFVSLFLLTPHLEFMESVIGFKWPGIATPIVDFFTVLAMIALLAILWRRITHPVLRLLSNREDYLIWGVTFLPLLTGYMSYHHLFFSYTGLLAVHILSAELLLVVFPFTKLTHTFTLFLSRWYNGHIAGQKGVQS